MSWIQWTSTRVWIIHSVFPILINTRTKVFFRDCEGLTYRPSIVIDLVVLYLYYVLLLPLNLNNNLLFLLLMVNTKTFVDIKQDCREKTYRGILISGGFRLASRVLIPLHPDVLRFSWHRRSFYETILEDRSFLNDKSRFLTSIDCWKSTLTKFLDEIKNSTSIRRGSVTGVGQ